MGVTTQAIDPRSSVTFPIGIYPAFGSVATPERKPATVSKAQILQALEPRGDNAASRSSPRDDFAVTVAPPLDGGPTCAATPEAVSHRIWIALP